MKRGIVHRIKNKLRLIKAKQSVSQGKIHDKAWSQKEAQNFWRSEVNKEEENLPTAYANLPFNQERGQYFLEKLEKLNLSKNNPILELGPNSGFILSFLYINGFHNLTGIEINPDAIKTMKEYFSNVYENCTIINDSLENALPQIPDGSFVLVYSMGAIMHVPAESNFIFEHIARISKKYIISVEGENMLSSRHYPRDYKKIYENLGFKQIFFEMTEKNVQDWANLHFRIFQKTKTI